MRHVPSSIVLIGLSLLAAACGGRGEGSRQHYAVVDSAGVQIVTNGAIGARGTEPIPVRETLRIGAREGAEVYNLYLVRGIAVGPGDTLFVPLLRESVIRVYAPGGSWVRDIGGPGQGPGEFGGLSRIFVTGDTVVATDSQNWRTTLFTTTGRLIEAWTIRRAQKHLFPYARVDAGWLVGLTDWGLQRYEAGSVQELRWELGIVRSIPEAVAALDDGPVWPEEVRVVLRYSAGRRFGMMMGPVVTSRAPLWEPAQRFAVSPDGQIHLTHPQDYQIDAYSPPGDLVRRIRRQYDPVPITGAMVDRFLSAVQAHYDTMPQRQTEFGTDPMDGYRAQAGLPPVPTLPALGRILASPSGALLVERLDLVEDPVALEWTRLGRQTGSWDWFDTDGRFQGTVKFEPSFTPMTLEDGSTPDQAGDRQGLVLYGVFRDELGVEFIIRNSIG